LVGFSVFAEMGADRCRLLCEGRTHACSQPMRSAEVRKYKYIESARSVQRAARKHGRTQRASSSANPLR
jgi:hypothetical protein